MSEKTYRRHYSQKFDFPKLNAQIIALATLPATPVIGVMDVSFCAKSGKHTYGVDWFYNGSASRSEKGLEISVLAVVDVAGQRGYALSVQQTPSTPNRVLKKRSGKRTPKVRVTVSQTQIQQSQELLERLPERSAPLPSSTEVPLPWLDSQEMTRMDYYLRHLQNTRAHFPDQLQYLAVDGFYSKQKFVDGVVSLDLQVIGKLR